MKGNDQTVWLDMYLVRETDKAMLVEIEGDETWIPKSQVRARRKGDDGELRAEVTRWFAEKEGLIDDKDDQ